MSISHRELIVALRALVDYVDRTHAARKGDVCACGVCPLCDARWLIDRWDHGRSQRGQPRPGASHVGERNPKVKLTEPHVREIREMLSAGLTCAEIGRRFGVGPWVVSDIRQGRTWSHVL